VVKRTQLVRLRDMLRDLRPVVAAMIDEAEH